MERQTARIAIILLFQIVYSSAGPLYASLHRRCLWTHRRYWRHFFGSSFSVLRISSDGLLPSLLQLTLSVLAAVSFEVVPGLVPST